MDQLDAPLDQAALDGLATAEPANQEARRRTPLWADNRALRASPPPFHTPWLWHVGGYVLDAFLAAFTQASPAQFAKSVLV